MQAILWDTGIQEDKARLYRLADGWRFMGIVTYDGRFVDERRDPIVRDPESWQAVAAKGRRA